MELKKLYLRIKHSACRNKEHIIRINPTENALVISNTYSRNQIHNVRIKEPMNIIG